MRHMRYRMLGSICAAALALGMVLSGCGVTTTTGVGGGVIRNTPTPWPTTAATATASTASSGPIPEFDGCPPVQFPTQPQYVRVGALNISVPKRLAGSPNALMPSNAPKAPYKIAASAVNNYAPNPPVNPVLSSGYLFQICNTTGASHTLTSIRATIASFTASSGAVTVWHICAGGPYNAATKQTTIGCGGGAGAFDWLEVNLSNNRTGASATAIVNSDATNFAGVNLPASIGPNKYIQVLITVKGLTSQGTYALTFDVSVDGTAPKTLTPSDGPFLIAPSASIWTGTACQTPAMQAQIPASSQDAYYVCPPIS